MDSSLTEKITNNRTDIEVIKTKVTHIEKWFYLFIVEFHMGLVGVLFYYITKNGL